ncbi:MAG: formyltetrahydrofolate deformylase [Halarchaeum sp.]
MTTDLTEILVVGDDDTGHLAQITNLVFEHGVNIEDLDQDVRDGAFRMTMHVDTSEMECSRDELRDSLSTLGDDLGLDIRVRYPEGPGTASIAALVTKESHCLEALLEAAESGRIDADVDVVIGNRPRLRSLAEEYDVPFHDVADENGVPDEDELLELLDEYEVDLIALARYIRILGPEVVFRYQHRIINVHPSLLPAFPGAAAYTQAIEGGVRIAGVTAHYVTPDLDQGPIITQRAFNVPDDAETDDLRERGQPLEADAFVEAIRLHLNGDVEIGRGRTYVDDDDAQLGLPQEADDLNPDEPVDEDLTVAAHGDD